MSNYTEFPNILKVTYTTAMTTQDILRMRLTNQGLSQPRAGTPEEVVFSLGAVQSQDYPGAKWALAQRLEHTTDASIGQAFTEGKILRTHVLRPTWHFVHPRDISWMLELTGPRVSKMMGSYNKQLELNESVFTRSHKAITELLRKQKIVTREEIKHSLKEVGIETNVQRLAHLVMQAELDRIIISGPKRGSQFTYMLFSERVPETSKLSADEALAELTKRYFTSHGPSQIRDFVWWSGLTVADVKKGLEINKKFLVSAEVDEKIYYFSPNSPTSLTFPTVIHLLPNYDEYTIAYKDRSTFYSPSSGIKIYSMGALTYPHVILYKGKVIGTWRREVKKNMIVIRPKFAEKPHKKVMDEFGKTIIKYEAFVGLEVNVDEK
jgi:hypothetical protein